MADLVELVILDIVGFPDPSEQLRFFPLEDLRVRVVSLDPGQLLIHFASLMLSDFLILVMLHRVNRVEN